jgi:hypothetical protein
MRVRVLFLKGWGEGALWGRGALSMCGSAARALPAAAGRQ